MIQDDNIQTLNEMKAQLDLLNKKLQDQHIVNDKMMRQAMKSKASNINRMGRIFAVLGTLVAFSTPPVFIEAGCSITFGVATFIMLLYCSFKTVHYHRELLRTDFGKENILNVAERVTRLRDNYKNWPKRAVPMIVIWFVWLCVEIYSVFGQEAIVMLVSCAIGGTIGGLIGTRLNKNVIHQSDDLLEQIKGYSE